MGCTALRQTELNFEFNQVRTPTKGYITNFWLRIGRYVVANQSVVALVDTASYWVDGYFNENVITAIQSGDQAVVTLPTYPGEPIKGFVDCLLKELCRINVRARGTDQATDFSHLIRQGIPNITP